ncbi:CPBP family intramembrane metalloprotease [Pseudomonas sp. ZM23]|uniref:CPBP family intramembrane metalloprotease n=1 Tax=Pseudomonas triclosanedens TaxID=2961893 RepID=A0ABY6ZSX4_9PSED|nr:CPBP family intramembrane glutamic endopeptidase [Pseudomonas triclosanedens]MCP8467333.1 CPBP family intramembrane metalloprotease [Pseudomonas triclosanedens]MCP8472660.1 CPBP family intramembrane metalloprotease [Pseudomonas triclosanedens]MCP8478721.1 CPBP family intramembrane metalloprotease [Pseudomonas triclosanedens]WAI47894.1 CPBP family intramembrane metalloprotease [Pseudomonas triclosanedens]
MLRTLLPLLPVVLLLCGFALGYVQPVGLLIGGTYVAWTLYGEPRMPRLLWWLVCLVASIALAAHLLPGTSSWTLWPVRQLSPDAPVYALRLSWDKALVGATLLVWWLRREPVPAEKRSPDFAAIAIVTTLFAVPLVAVASGLVVWNPKWPPGFWLWMAVNVGVIALTEEAFFRGLLQSELVRRLGAFFGVALSSLLFGLVHWPINPLFAVVAGIAGLGYGLAFYFSGRLLVTVLLHAAVNCLHLLLFSYPLRII